MKMSSYYFNRKEILQKANERYSKEKTAEYYYLENKEAIKKTSRDSYKNFSKEEKDKIKRVPKKEISRTDSVQNRSITK